MGSAPFTVSIIIMLFNSSCCMDFCMIPFLCVFVVLLACFFCYVITGVCKNRFFFKSFFLKIWFVFSLLVCFLFPTLHNICNMQIQVTQLCDHTNNYLVRSRWTVTPLSVSQPSFSYCFQTEVFADVAQSILSLKCIVFVLFLFVFLRDHVWIYTP